jgi:hypothetical protein
MKFFFTVVNLFLLILQHNGMLKGNTAIVSEAKEFYTQKIQKRNLLNSIEDIFISKRCL